jgi:hypothetical protein
MRRIFVAAMVIGYCFLGIVAPAAASFISLNTSLTTKVTGRQLLVLVKAENKGDETAYNVQAEIRVAHQSVLGQKVSQLPVNSRYQAEFSIPLSKLAKPGCYPLALLLHYTDANQYPFSALSCQTFNFNSTDLPPEIFGKMTAGSFWKKGEVKLSYKNLGDNKFKLAISLITPRELTVSGEKKTLLLSAKSAESLTIPVENFSALSGSNYQIFALAEYNLGDKHQTVIVPGMIRIADKTTLLGLDRNLLIVILVALLAIFSAAQLLKKK